VIRKPFVAADLAERMHQLVSDPKLNPSFREARQQIVRQGPSSRGRLSSTASSAGVGVAQRQAISNSPDRVFPIENAAVNEGDGARTRNHRIDSPVL
jgi:hypothetical protein